MALEITVVQAMGIEVGEETLDLLVAELLVQ
jgi:hypothetical protein